MLAFIMSALTPPPGLFDRRTWLQRLVLLQPGEGRAFLWAAAYFFFLLFSYYLLRPVRNTMGIRGELSNLPWLWTCTTLATLIVAPLFAWVTSRLPRRRFVPWLYRVIALSLLVFWVLLSTFTSAKNLPVAYAFFVWVSVYNLLSTSVFWGFMADVFTQEQGKRLFGAIGVGGTLGAICGATIPATLSGVIGPVHVILISVALLEVVAQCASGLCRHFDLRDIGLKSQISNRATREPDRNVWAGFALIARSPYLQLMVVFMLLFTLTSTFLEFEQARIVKSHFPKEADRTQLFSRIDLAVNILALLTQLFLTGRILTRLGVMTGLMLLPLLTIAGFAGLLWKPTVAMLLGVQIARRAMHYAVDRPTREVLYTVLGPDAKYKSKSFIDTFVYRSGDLAGAWATWLCNHLTIAVSLIGMAAAGAWALSGVALGFANRRLAAQTAREEQAIAAGNPSPDTAVQSAATPARR